MCREEGEAALRHVPLVMLLTTARWSGRGQDTRTSPRGPSTCSSLRSDDEVLMTCLRTHARMNQAIRVASSTPNIRHVLATRPLKGSWDEPPGSLRAPVSPPVRRCPRWNPDPRLPDADDC